MTGPSLGPRLGPLPKRDLPEGTSEAIGAFLVPNPRHPLPRNTPDRPKGYNALGTLARNTELLAAYQAFNGYIQLKTRLSLRQRELVILRLAVVRECEYEWLQHVIQALDVGLTEAEIEAVRTGRGDFSPLEAALLSAVDDLVGQASIGDQAWEALRAELDEPTLLDLIFTVGAYDALAMMMRSFGTPVDDDLRQWHAEHRPGRP